jgi:hypothetical protein
VFQLKSDSKDLIIPHLDLLEALVDGPPVFRREQLGRVRNPGPERALLQLGLLNRPPDLHGLNLVAYNSRRKRGFPRAEIALLQLGLLDLRICTE